MLDLSQSLLPVLSVAGSFSSSVLSSDSPSEGVSLSTQANAGTSCYSLSLNSGPRSQPPTPSCPGQTPGPSSSFANYVLFVYLFMACLLNSLHAFLRTETISTLKATLRRLAPGPKPVCDFSSPTIDKGST